MGLRLLVASRGLGGGKEERKGLGLIPQHPLRHVPCLAGPSRGEVEVLLPGLVRGPELLLSLTSPGGFGFVDCGFVLHGVFLCGGAGGFVGCGLGGDVPFELLRYERESVLTARDRCVAHLRRFELFRYELKGVPAGRDRCVAHLGSFELFRYRFKRAPVVLHSRVAHLRRFEFFRYEREGVPAPRDRCVAHLRRLELFRYELKGVPAGRDRCVAHLGSFELFRYRFKHASVSLHGAETFFDGLDFVCSFGLHGVFLCGGCRHLPANAFFQESEDYIPGIRGGVGGV